MGAVLRFFGSRWFLTFLGIFLVEYLASSDGGTRLRDVVAFSDYLHWRLFEGTSELIMRTGHHTTFDNGGVYGWVRLALQVLSFGIGPLAVLQKENDKDTKPSPAASPAS